MEEQKNNQTAVEVKTEDETQYDEIQKVKQVERTDSYFDGKVLEWLGYRILAFIITAVTFGIANAWAEKLLIAYTIDHTVYNGKRLKFEDAAFDAEIGKVVGPVKTQFGHHLIKVEKKNESSTASFDEVRGQIYQQLMAEKQNDAYTAKVDELKEKYLEKAI